MRSRRLFVQNSSSASTLNPDMPPFGSLARGVKQLSVECKHNLTFIPCIHSSKTGASNVNSAIEPYSYTRGRWLDHDRLERESRHIQFDFSALCKKAIELCLGAKNVAEYEKKDGGFNRVFFIVMDDGQPVVARLQTSVAGPPRLTTNSEVVTITCCKHESWYWLAVSSC